MEVRTASGSRNDNNIDKNDETEKTVNANISLLKKCSTDEDYYVTVCPQRV